MEIMQTRVLYGPNRWTQEYKVIELDVAMGHPQSPDAAATGSYAIEGTERVPFFEKYFPGETSGKYKIEDLFRYLIMEVHEQAKITYDFVATRLNTDHYFCYLVYSFKNERLSVRVGRTVVKIAAKLIENAEYDWKNDINELMAFRSGMRSEGATTNYLLQEVERRKIPYRKFAGSSLAVLGYGKNQRKIRTAITDSTSGLGMEVASDKEETKDLLRSAHLPVPNGIIVGDAEELEERIDEVRFPFVVKPLNGNQGRGVTTNINSLDDALAALPRAQRISDLVVVEEYVEGDDYRFLVVNYKFVAATKRVPAHVIGNGSSSIMELIEEENKNPQRGSSSGGHVLAIIKIDKPTERILASKNYSLETILPEGEVLILKDTANISAGGIAEDMTDVVHPENIFMAEHVARLFNLDICGIDVMTKRVDQPITRDTGAIIEVNAGPGVRMHSNPQKGNGRNVAEHIINMLFEDAAKTRIPVIAFSGSVPDEILIWLSQAAGDACLTAGCAGPAGICIKGFYTYNEDATDFYSSQDVLFDPMVDIAFLSCEYDSIEDFGLPFDHCEVAVIMNREQRKIEEIASAPDALLVLARSVLKTGYAILDADDDTIYALKDELECTVILVSLDPDNPRIAEHREQGRMVAVLEKGEIALYSGVMKTSGLKIEDLPEQFNEETGNRLKDLLAVPIITQIYSLKAAPKVEEKNKG